ncbi:hypothetical protein [Dactylosporangium sp. CA-139066]|uniref:hypothetical protein n=1 Tax=Dactylosporangium sp. CA-139066 TaxID=3239930 RepID=UPI003D8FA8EC
MSEYEWRRTLVRFERVDVKGVAHAVTRRTTRCGIPLSARQLASASGAFEPGREGACARCSEAVAATPAPPSPQEQLYRRILDAEPAHLRDELIAALRAGPRSTRRRARARSAPRCWSGCTRSSKGDPRPWRRWRTRAR